jgi:trehalose/maltose hydrolase-like predicted phosphorylase
LTKFAGVQAPDEYHAGVNNSAFTNAVAKISLQNAAKVANLSGSTPDLYSYYAEHIYIPYDEELRFHPEYDGYTKGRP